MSIPNIGPEHSDPGGLDAGDNPRRGNSLPVYLDEPLTDDVTAASTRASTVSHRFGGVRYALTRPSVAAADHAPPAEEDESDAR
ncbi:hypothetical protein ACWKSP_21125 [Micromonosporaceae bacterium Da 78-11]